MQRHLAQTAMEDTDAAINLDKLLRLAEIALKAGVAARAHDALNRLSQSLHRLSDVQLVKFIKLADQTERPQLLADAIRHVSVRGDVSAALGLAILEKAHTSGDDALADSVEDAIAERMPAVAEREFRARVARMRLGPDACVDVLRATKTSKRTPAAAAYLGEALVAAGRSKLAARYLRRCQRRWPRSPAIGTRLVQAYLKSGQPDDARAFLRSVGRDYGARTFEAMALNLALFTGDVHDGYEILSAQVAKGSRRKGDVALLRVLVTLERLEEADEIVSAIRTEKGQPVRTASHFGVMHLGALLNELHLYRRLSSRQDGQQPDPTEIANQFFAAKQVLDGWEAANPWTSQAEGTTTSIPKRIFQYWDEEEIPPAVLGVMESWRSVPAWQYQCLDRRGAMDWLGSTFGVDHARAFKLANHAAEESDFLRLCLLYEHGGIYADADDKLVGSLSDLVSSGPGMILFRSVSLGSVDNNLICAPAKHPLLGKAIELSMSALLRRDNDSTWSKTGPGLLARAAALHIAEDPEAARSDLSLVPGTHMHRHVHPHVQLPYKTTPKYWDANSAEVDQTVRDALQRIADMTSPE